MDHIISHTDSTLVALQLTQACHQLVAPRWFVAQSSVAQLVCRPGDRTPLSHRNLCIVVYRTLLQCTLLYVSHYLFIETVSEHTVCITVCKVTLCAFELCMTQRLWIKIFILFTDILFTFILHFWTVKSVTLRPILSWKSVACSFVSFSTCIYSVGNKTKSIRPIL